MSGDAHVQFWESLGVRFPGATRRNIYVRSERAGQRDGEHHAIHLERSRRPRSCKKCPTPMS